MESLREFLSNGLSLPDASLMPFAIGVLLVAVGAYGVLRWAMRARVERRVRVHCPVHDATTTVLCRLGPDGTPVEIERCDLLTRSGLRACDSACLKTLVEQAA
ncbi:MAG: hypothetical protein ACRELS_06380 [Candidatus Rokuibacteriota bacterium]